MTKRKNAKAKLKNTLNKKKKRIYIALPELRVNENIKDLLKVVNLNLRFFYSCHAFSVILCCIIGQIRSKALTTGKSFQEIQKIDSLRFYSKTLASHLKPLTVAKIFSLNKLLPLLTSEEAETSNVQNIFNSFRLSDDKATIKMSKESIMASYENKLIYGRGLLRSYIGKMQTTPIFSPHNLGKYNDITIRKLKDFIQGGDSMDLDSLIDSIQELFSKETITIFRDNINLSSNNPENLVLLEKSLELPIKRKYDEIVIPANITLDEKEKNISPLERLRRKKIKEINQSLYYSVEKIKQN